MNKYTSHPSEAAVGRFLAAPAANINNGAIRSNIGALIAEVEPSVPGEADRPLYYLGTDADLTAEARNCHKLLFWRDSNGTYLVKSPIGGGYYVSETDLNDLVQEIEADHEREVALPTSREPIAALTVGPNPELPQEDVESSNVADENAAPDAGYADDGDSGQAPVAETAAAITDHRAPDAAGGGPINPPVETVPLPAPAWEPESQHEAVIKLACASSLEGPFVRESDNSPVDPKTTTTSFVFYQENANTVVVLKNAFSNRRVPCNT